MKKIEKNKGITLIALVITIIILLILAGISVTTLQGENGVITNASKAAFKTEVSGIKEQVLTDRIMDIDKKELQFATLDKLIGRTDKYNEIISMEDGKLVYDKEKVSEKEAKWLEEMDIHEKQGVIPIYTAEQLQKIASRANCNYRGDRRHRIRF